MGSRGSGGIAPYDIVEVLAVDVETPVAGLTLVGTTRACRCRREEVQSHVELWDVVADGKAGLEEQHRSTCVGNDGVGDPYDDVPGRVQDVDPLVGIAGVAKDLLVFFEPCVHRVPNE